MNSLHRADPWSELLPWVGALPLQNPMLLLVISFTHVRVYMRETKKETEIERNRERPFSGPAFLGGMGNERLGRVMRKEKERGELGFLASSSSQQSAGILSTRTGTRGALQKAMRCSTEDCSA